MLSEARQKKIMEKLNRAQKCSILGPQNLGSGGGGPGSAPDSNDKAALHEITRYMINTSVTCMI